MDSAGSLPGFQARPLESAAVAPDPAAGLGRMRNRQADHPFRLPAIRLGSLVALILLSYGGLRAVGVETGFPPLQPFTLILLTVISGWAVRRELLSAGCAATTYLGACRDRLWRDLAQGVGWLMVTYAVMIVPLIGTMLLLFGGEALSRFETVFAPSAVALTPAVSRVLGAASLVAALLFVLNAPIEEAIFRGWLQAGLSRRWGPAPAIVVQALVFGAQHTLLAYNLRGGLVMGVAFFFWGLAAGWIVHWQGRLMPVVIAHWIANLLTGVIPQIAVGMILLGG